MPLWKCSAAKNILQGCKRFADRRRHFWPAPTDKNQMQYGCWENIKISPCSDRQEEEEEEPFAIVYKTSHTDQIRIQIISFDACIMTRGLPSQVQHFTHQDQIVSANISILHRCRDNYHCVWITFILKMRDFPSAYDQEALTLDSLNQNQKSKTLTIRALRAHPNAETMEPYSKSMQLVSACIAPWWTTF